MDCHTLSTFDKKTVDSYLKMWHKIIDEKYVETISLENLFDEYLNWNNIDIL